jgi:hypothetical protein
MAVAGPQTLQLDEASIRVRTNLEQAKGTSMNAAIDETYNNNWLSETLSQFHLSLKSTPQSDIKRYDKCL